MITHFAHSSNETNNTVEPLLSHPQQFGWTIERLDNRKVEIMGLKGIGRVALRSDN